MESVGIWCLLPGCMAFKTLAFSFYEIDPWSKAFLVSRCGGMVFSAEEIHSGGKSYHKKCATCHTCEKQLTFNTVFDGEDKVTNSKGISHLRLFTT